MAETFDSADAITACANKKIEGFFAGEREVQGKIERALKPGISDALAIMELNSLEVNDLAEEVAIRDVKIFHLKRLLDQGLHADSSVSERWANYKMACDVFGTLEDEGLGAAKVRGIMHEMSKKAIFADTT